MPEPRNAHDNLMTDQEDWGWFARFKDRDVRLAIDVFCDDADSGSYRLHLTSRVPKWILGQMNEDTAELESLRDRVTRTLATWLGRVPRTTRVKANGTELSV